MKCTYRYTALSVPTQLGPKGDMRRRGVLSVMVKLPEVHIPPWYWFRKASPWPFITSPDWLFCGCLLGRCGTLPIIPVIGHFDLEQLWPCSTRRHRSLKHRPTAFSPRWPPASPNRTASASRTPWTAACRPTPAPCTPRLAIIRGVDAGPWCAVLPGAAGGHRRLPAGDG